MQLLLLLECAKAKANNFLDAIANDDRIPLKRTDLDALIGNPLEFTGDARQQVARVVTRIEAITSAHPAAAQYKPQSDR
jgi:adenylosuccinate lyase